jgi:hypothetical protein
VDGAAEVTRAASVPSRQSFLFSGRQLRQSSKRKPARVHVLGQAPVSRGKPTDEVTTLFTGARHAVRGEEVLAAHDARDRVHIVFCFRSLFLVLFFFSRLREVSTHRRGGGGVCCGSQPKEGNPLIQ